MATYKVIQDIEAEDKLIGPFSLRQFIYAIIVIVCGLLAFQIGKVAWWLAIPFAPIMLFFGALAAPLGKDQSTEVWLLAKIRFSLKPRRRIWDQSGMKQLVTITAPKKMERRLTNGLSQTEVKSRLQALADVIDSRGWSTKNSTINAFTAPGYGSTTQSLMSDSDRLVNMNSGPMEVPSFDVSTIEDMLDERNNPRAQQLNQMVAASTEAHRKQAVAIARGEAPPQPAPAGIGAVTPSAPAAPADYWFLNQTSATAPQGLTTFSNGPLINSSAPSTPPPPVPAPFVVPDPQLSAPITAADEAALLEHIKEDERNYSRMKGHIKTIPTAEERRQKEMEAARQKAAEATMTRQPDPVIMNLANNDDLDVATIARQANKQTTQSSSSDEVVISLH